MKPRIYLSSPHMGGNELKYIHEAFEQNWIAPLGPNVNAFEKELCKATGVKHAAALSSGTSAIHLALIMLGVQPGDYVIVQSFTFGATAFPVKYLGATPVFIDSEPETWNMDPELLEKAIVDCVGGTGLRLLALTDEGASVAQGTGHRAQGSGHRAQSAMEEKRTDPKTSSSSPRRSGTVSSKGEFKETNSVPCALSSELKLPKAIIAVDLYGMPAKWKDILTVAERYGIPVIEDAAEALGSRYDGKMCGSVGMFGILSFNGNKIITTSGGGALLSDDEELIKRARFLSTQSRDHAPHYQHSVIGYNYRMSNVVAGIGRGQLEVLNERVKARRENFEWYKNHLSDLKGISFIEEPGPEYFSNRWLTTIIFDPGQTGGVTREDIRIALEAENIESRPLWKPMHLQPVFTDAPAYVNGTSEKLFTNGLCLPSGSNLTEEQRWMIEGIIRKVLKR